MDDINRNLSRLQLFPDYDTTPMSLEDINEMTTTKALMHTEAVLKELIKLCNLNSEKVKEIYAQWNELITTGEDGKNLLKELREFISNNQHLLDIDNNISLLIKKSLNIANVKNFGAVGDGVTDDTEAFKLALQFSNTLYLPYGNYVLTEHLENVSIIGSKNATKINHSTEDYLIQNENETFIIANINFNSDNVSRGNIYLNRCINSLVFNCNFSGYSADHGYYKTDSQILINESSNTLILSCSFKDNGYKYDTNPNTLNRCITTQQGENTKIAYCYINKVNQGIINDTDNTVINNCYFDNVKDNNIYSFKSCTITNCYISNKNDEGIVIGGGDYIISNNKLEDIPNKFIAITNNCNSLICENNIFIYNTLL